MRTFQVLHIADCPGTVTLLERLAALADVEVETRLVGDAETAVALGMTGSPTILVDGRDPFADGSVPSLACRLYRDGSGSPSVSQLHAVLVGTGARARGLPEESRGPHRLILGGFLATGRAPDREWLREHGIGADDVRRLSTEDLVQLDEAGGVAVAYPFSGRPTAHRVHLAGGPEVWAMCAIDALGIPLMAGRAGVIESRDALTGEPIRVSMDGWEPAGTVVLVARSAGGGPISCCACPHMNFHASAESARSYLDDHDGLSGQVLDQAAAVELADLCFGSLLVV